MIVFVVARTFMRNTMIRGGQEERNMMHRWEPKTHFTFPYNVPKCKSKHLATMLAKA